MEGHDADAGQAGRLVQVTKDDEESVDPVVTEAITSLRRVQLDVRSRASDVTDLIFKRMTPAKGIRKVTVK